MKFNKFVRKYLGGLRLLNVSLAEYGPGLILHRKKLRKLGSVKEVLKNSDHRWTINRSEASITYGVINGTKNLKGGGNVLGLIGISGSYNRDYQAEFEISGIEGSEFKHQSQLTLQPEINKIRRTDPKMWKLINDHLMVTEAFYATKFTVTFRSGTQVLGQVDLEDKIRLNAEASIDWKNQEVLEVTNNLNVPFGVRGFYI